MCLRFESAVFRVSTRTEAIHLLDTALQECLADYLTPDDFGGFDADSRGAAEVAVDTLLANPDVLRVLAESADPGQ